MNDARPLAVVVAVTRGDGRYLLVKRAKGLPAEGYWVPVSGKVEPGESLSDAAARECLEEVGIAVRVGRELTRGETDDARYALVWMEARSVEDAPAVIAKADEVEDWRWVTREEVEGVAPMFDATREVFRSRLG
ncbi:MAG: NUDIX hydrolase [Polyangiales bacterium]